MSLPVATADRHGVIDGLRGYAILLVLLSHLWIVSPTSDLRATGWRVLFGSGNYAVTVLLVISGCLATHVAMTRQRSSPPMRIVARWVRLSAPVYAVLVVVAVVSWLDPGNSQHFPGADIDASVSHIVTYTWTGFLAHEPLRARPDLGHFWYVSADLGGFVILTVLLVLTRCHRLLLPLLLGLCTIAVTQYRIRTFHRSGDFVALVRWQTRFGGMLVGALVVTLLAGSDRVRRSAQRVEPLAVLGLIAAAWAVVETEAYVGFREVGLGVCAAVIVGLALTTPAGDVTRRPPALSRAFDRRVLRNLGQLSFVLYIWHYPVFWFASRHFQSIPWAVSMALSLIVSFSAALLTRRWIELPAAAVARRLVAPGVA